MKDFHYSYKISHAILHFCILGLDKALRCLELQTCQKHRHYKFNVSFLPECHPLKGTSVALVFILGDIWIVLTFDFATAGGKMWKSGWSVQLWDVSSAMGGEAPWPVGGELGTSPWEHPWSCGLGRCATRFWVILVISWGAQRAKSLQNKCIPEQRPAKGTDGAQTTAGTTWPGSRPQTSLI